MSENNFNNAGKVFILILAFLIAIVLPISDESDTFQNITIETVNNITNIFQNGSLWQGNVSNTTDAEAFYFGKVGINTSFIGENFTLNVSGSVFVLNNLSVSSLIVRNQSSICIGGCDFAIISASDFLEEIANISRPSVEMNRDLIVRYSNFNGTVYGLAQNTDNASLATTWWGATNDQATGVAFLKHSSTYFQPHTGDVFNGVGDMRVLNGPKHPSIDAPKGLNMSFGFWGDFVQLDNLSYRDWENITINMKLIPEKNFMLKPTEFNETVTFGANVTINESLEVKGNMSSNDYYGYANSTDQDEVISIASSNVWYNITSIRMNGKRNGFLNDTYLFTPVKTGNYIAMWTVSFMNGATVEYEASLAINNTKQIDCADHATTPAVSKAAVISQVCVLSLGVHDEVGLQIRNLDNTMNPTIHHANLILLRVSDIAA